MYLYVDTDIRIHTRNYESNKIPLILKCEHNQGSSQRGVGGGKGATAPSP